MVLGTVRRHKGCISSGRCGRLAVVGRLIISNAMTVNGAYEAPVPEPGGWLVMDPDSQQASLEMWQAADAMVMGRKTYEGLATVWPQMADLPGFEAYARQMNTMPKYVASRTLSSPLTWNATLLEGDLADSVRGIKAAHEGNLIVTGAGELARDLLTQDLVDEVWLHVSPYLWGTGPRIFDDVGAMRLDLVATTTYPSGAVVLRYRTAGSAAPAAP
jgi:dihydrofolate reductase